MKQRVSDLEIDTERRRLCRGDARLPLPELSFEAFAYLVARAPATVSPAEFARDVWRLDHVSDETIAQRIALLRRALGDDPKDPRYIRTVRGEGYALAAPVEILNADDGAQPAEAVARRRRLRFARAALASALVALVALGLAGLWQSGARETPQAPAAEAATTVDALIARARDQLRVQQAAETDRAISLLGEALARDAKSLEARTGLSFALSTRATKFAAELDDESRAEALARSVLAEDESDSAAWHALAFALDAQGRIDEALAAYRRAYALDPADGAALSSAAYLLSVRGQLFDALQLEARALGLPDRSRYADSQIARSLEILGAPAAEFWRAQSLLLNPGQSVAVAEAVEARLRRGEGEAALALLATAADDSAAAPRLSRLKGRAFLMLGNYAEARTAFEQAGAEGAMDITALDAMAGDGGAVAALVRKFRVQMQSGDSWPGLRIRLAELLAAQGETDLALDYVRQAVDLGWRDAGAVRSSPFFAILIRTQGWNEIEARIEREIAAQRAIISLSEELTPLTAPDASGR